MNFNILIAVFFGILALVLGAVDTLYAGYAFNKEDKTGAINNTTPMLFLFTGILVIVYAVYYINSNIFFP